MEKELKFVTDWLLCATSQIASLQLPVAGSMDAKYLERVYCYELYHRWRGHWPEEFRFSLCGEVDKSGHSIIKGGRLKNAKPDFLVHIPGRRDQRGNLLALEVKRGNSDLKDWVDDIAKLHDFRREPACYYAVYFLVYGLSRSDWNGKKGRLRKEISALTDVNPARVRYLLHESPNARAKFVSLE